MITKIHKAIFAIMLVGSCLICRAAKFPANTTDSLSFAVRINNKTERSKKLTNILYNRYLLTSAFDNSLNRLSDTLGKYGISEAPLLLDLAQVLIYRRRVQLMKAENELIKAIEKAHADNNDYLLYHFHLNLAFVQTDKGDDIGAVHSYRLARKQAELLNEPRLQATSDIGISDIYTRVQLYKEALLYLNQAESYSLKNLGDKETRSYIALNKAEIFFKLKKQDSLQFYIRKINNGNDKIYDMKGSLNRLRYYSFILDGRYNEAIHMIKKLTDNNYHYYKNFDYLYLAQCYERI